jgi:ABC-type uncharacterized transport system substrate-binding protein
MRSAAQSLGLGLLVREVHRADELEQAFATAVKEGAGGLVVRPAPFLATYESRIADLAIRHRLPAISWRPHFVERGGLMAYGPSLTEMWRRAAALVDKLLKGAKPADLPVEQATKFELVINRASRES